MDELPKSWINKEAYKKVRLEEAKYEAELAKKFLEQGLTRNAAGKIFQAVKALVAAKAVDNMDKLEKEYKGKVKLRNGKKVERAEWIVTVMPTTYLKRVAQLLDEELDAMVDKALHIHAFQYNGPDKEMLVSIYPDEITASRDILYLIKKINEIIDKS